jgi:hypothetical protein
MPNQPKPPAQALPTLQQVLDSPSTSNWLKNALRSAIQRDCVDAANDAEVLAALLRRHANWALYGLRSA